MRYEAESGVVYTIVTSQFQCTFGNARNEKEDMSYEVLTPPPGIAGASGVVVHDHHLLIVSDDSPGWYLRVALPFPVPNVLPIPNELPTVHQILGGINASAALPLDIESIDVIGSDRVVLL